MDRPERIEEALTFLLDSLDHQYLPAGTEMSFTVLEGIAYGHAALNPDPTSQGDRHERRHRYDRPADPAGRPDR
jgi:hypothetical protein